MDLTERERLTQELRRREAFLAEAQKLSRTGSFGWRVSTGEITWSAETFRIFGYERTTTPTVELILQRVHREDLAGVKETIERATRDGKDFDHEYRLAMTDGSITHVHVVAHVSSDESGGTEFIGAVMDVTAAKQVEGGIRRIIDTIPAYAWTITPDGSVDFINHRFVEFTGRPAEDLLGWGWGSTHHPDDLPRLVGLWRAALAAGEALETEVRVRRWDGEYRWVLIRNVPLRDEQGHILKWYGTAIEIEDRKRAEVLLAGEKHLLEMIARGKSRALILEGACLLVEELASGCLSSVLLLDPQAKCLRHGAAPSLPLAYTAAIDGGAIGPSAGSCGTAAYRAEPVIVSDIASDPLWANYRDLALAHGLRSCWSTPILSSAGQVLGTFATYYREPRSPSPQEHTVIERISQLASIAVERTQAEERLRQSEAYLFEVQRLSHTGSMHWKVSNGELSWSDEACRIFEYDLTTTPRPELVRQRIHPNDRAFVQQTENRHRKGDYVDVDFEYRLLMPDGRVKHLHAIAHPLHDSSGNLEVVSAVMDVTAIKQGDEALRQAQADLAHVSRVTTMGEMTASLAHEVSQPIAAAVTNANACLRWLAGDIPNLEEARAAAARIVRDGTRVAAIISRLRLLFTKGAPQRELVDVNEVIREMILLLRKEAMRYSLSVRTELAADLPQVMGDRVQLQQVIMNLILNSFDAMKDMDATRELAIKSRRAEHQQLLVSVSDTGVGLPPQRDQIFNAFFTTKLHGIGMGLSISRSIVESHGGRLWAADNSPRGASFCLTLPTTVDAH
jgi:PAS domain S-box-containing protein